MKTFRLILSLAVIFTSHSCAHESGHKRNASEPSTAPVSGLAQTGSSSHNVDVIVSNQRGDSNKLDGAKVFARYNTAVFMVYTSDGRNAYQGSGFFINSDGLAVSNYHVFEGTNIGNEQIKLTNSNEVHKVSEVIHSNEAEDFILFRVDVPHTNFIPIAKYKPQVGEKVYAIGSPRGLENTFSSGEVSQWRDKNLEAV